LTSSRNIQEKRRGNMPVITVDISTMTTEKKAELVKELTVKASEVTKIPEEKFIVLVNEMPRENIGIGGRLLSEIMK
jgi:4-oxalocrotonate tautomerase